MTCNHCGSEWTTAVENQKDSCPFCGKKIGGADRSNASDLDKFFDEQIQQIHNQQSKEIRWAQLLGCKPGKTPWVNIKSGLFTDANKIAQGLIARITDIHDQELLYRIATESNRADVCCATIPNIYGQDTMIKLAYHPMKDVRLVVLPYLTDCKTLEDLAQKDPSPAVRERVFEYITNREILEQIARTDPDERVRTIASLRFATASQIKAHFMNSKNDYGISALSSIKQTSDLLQLAVLAKCNRVRVDAMNRLPANLAERKLLKETENIASSLTLVNMVRFQKLSSMVKGTNPWILQHLAHAHNSEDVRFLAHEAEGGLPSTSSKEAQLRKRTPSEQMLRCKELWKLTVSETNSFITRCNNAAQSGRHSYTCKIGGYDSVLEWNYEPFKFHWEAEWVADVMQDELRLHGFANISTHCGYEHNTVILEVSTSW